MSQYPACLCCSYELLHRVSARGTVWFCAHCFQEMPDPKLLYRRRVDSLEAQVLSGQVMKCTGKS